MPDDPMDHSDNEGPSAFNYDDVAEGNIHIDISHAGGEMGDLQDALNEELNGKKYVHPAVFSMSVFELAVSQETVRPPNSLGHHAASGLGFPWSNEGNDRCICQLGCDSSRVWT
jgi:hypothetical protein